MGRTSRIGDLLRAELEALGLEREVFSDQTDHCLLHPVEALL